MRTVLLRALLVLLGLVAGLLLSELGARFAGMDPLVSLKGVMDADNVRATCLRPAPFLGYEVVPGSCGSNSLGHMDREPPATKPPGSLRVLALGDSITEMKAWVEILELRLGERLPVEVDVWNMGLTGYSVLNELEVLKHRALHYEPDAVVLQLCMNDYGFTPILFRHQGELQWLRATTGGMGPASLWLFERSVLFRYLVLRASSLHMAGMGNPEHMAEVDAALAEMLRLCQERDIPFVLVIFPTLAPAGLWPPGEQQAHDSFVAAADRIGIPYRDLTPRMLAGPVEDLRRYEGDRVYADMDAQLAVWGLPADWSGMLRGVDTKIMGVDRPAREHMKDDWVHPNWLGHAVAAHALEDWLVEALGE